MPALIIASSRLRPARSSLCRGPIGLSGPIGRPVARLSGSRARVRLASTGVHSSPVTRDFAGGYARRLGLGRLLPSDLEDPQTRGLTDVFALDQRGRIDRGGLSRYGLPGGRAARHAARSGCVVGGLLRLDRDGSRAANSSTNALGPCDRGGSHRTRRPYPRLCRHPADEPTSRGRGQSDLADHHRCMGSSAGEGLWLEWKDPPGDSQFRALRILRGPAGGLVPGVGRRLSIVLETIRRLGSPALD